MGRRYGIIRRILLFLIGAALIGCSKENKLPNTFSIEDFKEAVTKEGYVFEIQDAEDDFLQTTRKRMIIQDIEIDMYLFKNDKDMEKEANYIDNSGSSYDNGSINVHVSWSNYPYFYKKGSLIVQYVGENQNIISSLEKILGQQFAGYKN